MKILITGSNGNISKSFAKYLTKFNSYDISFISLRDNSWKALDFSVYDAIFHSAGIVNSEKTDYSEYKKVNVDLTKELYSI